ncbi:anaerobic C4-dicarboxylate transporter family protein [Amycolatopsis sp. GM8]|uniref:anaerobic C4-dicarboxylate transporter family protein n=1 Tax=Amycolatopsis sp. GM8 TaxID=2896530 RepID=UPI001EEE842F|nr:anaerobic C4-dicarboxylate transporter family protein [Amycolatopsis sp. GM8]
METVKIILEAAVVAAALFMGVRTGGIGLGVWGLVGTLVLVVGFQLKPGSPPVEAVLIVAAVIVAASVMQAAGGIDWMVRQAAKAISKNPHRVVYYAPFMAFLFTVGAGTGNIYYPLLPVIYDVSYSQQIRPERALAVSAVASQVGILASPVSAATASMTALLGPKGFTLGKILLIMWPASVVGLLVAAFVMTKIGKPLEKDLEYQKRLAEGRVPPPAKTDLSAPLPAAARTSALIFLAGVLIIVAAGLFSGLAAKVLPALKNSSGHGVDITLVIEMVMGLVAAVTFLACRVKAGEVTKQSTFPAGIVGAIALFGIAWLANTFVAANSKAITHSLGGVVGQAPLLFAVALALVAMLTTSQSSATNAIVPIGLSIGLSSAAIVGMWPATMGIYLLPANGSQIATVGFDQTGTTRIGKYVINHSFLVPTVVFIVVGVAVGLLLSQFIG